ncbi:MAG: outer membrane lipid asymmetry maintenance protein MlaD [Litorivicinus sp.]
MSTRVIEICVGAFVALGLAAMAWLAISVSGLSFTGPSDEYLISARFSNVAGLKPRAKVTSAGVTVGRVADIRLDPEVGQAEVIMAIESRFDQFPLDSTASILTAGLLGEKYIGLRLGAEFDMLIDGDEIMDTQSSLVLEDLIGRFLLNSTGGD